MAEPSVQNADGSSQVFPERLMLCRFLLLALAMWTYTGPQVGRATGPQEWRAVEVIESLFLVCPLLAVIPYLVARTLKDETARPAARFMAIGAGVIFVVLVWLLAHQVWGRVAWLVRT